MPEIARQNTGIPALWARVLIRRLGASFAVALLVAGTAYICAWYEYGGYITSTLGAGSFAVDELDRLHKALKLHRQTTGSYPRQLQELNVANPGSVRVDETGLAVDIWGTPYQYQVGDGNYTLFSFGRDKAPGGAGLDADIYGREMQDSRATLWQFTFDLETRGIQATCGLAGASTFLLCLCMVVGRRTPGVSWRAVAVKVCVTAAAAIFTAVAISVVHLPTGH